MDPTKHQAPPTRAPQAPNAPAPQAMPPGEKDVCPVTGRPISAGLRMLPQEAQDEFMMKRLAQEQRFALTGERMKRRAIMYGIGGAIGLVLVNVMTPVGWALFPVQLLLGAVYGVVLAYMRFTGPMGGFTFLFTGVLSMLITGHTAILTSFMGAFSCALYFCMGLAVGISEASKMADGN